MRRGLLAFAALLALGALVWALRPAPPDPAPEAEVAPRADGGAARRKPTLAELARLAQPPPAPRRTGSIAGLVQGAQGPAVVAAESGGRRFRAEAGPDGAFNLPDLPPGDYTLTASAGARSSEPLGPVPLGEGEQVRDLVLTLAEGGALAGHVLDAHHRTPVAHAALSAGGAEASSAEDGAFELRGLPPGEATLVVRAPGYVEARSQVVVARGKRQSGAEVLLLPAAKVAGKVQQSDGSPVAGVAVLAQRYAFGAPSAPSELCTTDEAGHFEGELEPGRVTLFAPVPGGEARSEEFDLHAGEERKDLVLTADVGGQLVGRVLEADGSPAPGASVSAVEMLTQRQVGAGVAGPEGRFQFEGLPSGQYSVVARLGARAAQAGGLRVEAGEVASAEVRFGEATLAGRVLDASNRPVLGAQVSAAPEGGRSFAATTVETGPDGSFKLAGLAGERFAVEAVHVAGKAEAHGVAAGEKELVLRIQGQSAIKGFVADDQGHAVSDFRVSAEPLDAGLQPGKGGARVTGRFASATGDFYLAVQPGRYAVRVSAAGFATAEAGQAEAPLGGTSAELRVTLHRARIINVQVVNAQGGQPVPGARVATNPNLLFAFGRANPVRSGTYGVADASGRATLLDAEPGDVSLFATADGFGWAQPVRVPARQDPSAVVRVTLAPGDNGNHDFAGVGMQIMPNFQVNNVFEGGPADLAGVRNGDTLVSVDGKPVAGHALTEVITWIRGEAGTPVAIGLTRGGQGFTVVPTRADIKF